MQLFAAQSDVDSNDPMTLVPKARRMRAEELHRLVMIAIGRVTAVVVTLFALPIDYI
ncbi:MAG: hypothetical protein IPM60_04905 [Rhodospirillales bacterium]|nr:hypothetical protein [Rhodospirillales bacterium]